MNVDIEKLKTNTCPFCGCDANPYEHHQGYWMVMCISCEAEGPAGISRNEAVERWNRRSAPAAGTVKDAERYRAWRDAVLNRDEEFVDEVGKVIPVSDDDLTADRWDAGIDAAIEAHIKTGK